MEKPPEITFAYLKQELPGASDDEIECMLGWLAPPIEFTSRLRPGEACQTTKDGSSKG